MQFTKFKFICTSCNYPFKVMFAILEMDLYDQMTEFNALIRQIRYQKTKCFGIKVKIFRTLESI